MEEVKDSTEEETQPEEDTVVLKKTEHEKLLKDSGDKSGLVSEIKELRGKNQLTEKELVELREENKTTDVIESTGELTPEKIEEITERKITETLLKKDLDEASKNRSTALEDFKRNHKEFHEENDEAGIKFAAFERTLELFKTENLKTVEQFSDLLEKALRLSGKDAIVVEEISTEIEPEPDNTAAPKEVDVSQTLHPKELKFIQESFGGDKKRYLEAKIKRPDYFEELLRIQ